MRNPSDIIVGNAQLTIGFELDFERMAGSQYFAADELWLTISELYNIQTPEGFEAALREYISWYLTEERLLSRVSTTNGPAGIFGFEVKIVQQKVVPPMSD